jgi:hypothetical protein
MACKGALLLQDLWPGPPYFLKKVGWLKIENTNLHLSVAQIGSKD